MQQAIAMRARAVSFVELIVGICIVIGHNVLHILPNEVTVLLVLGWISLRLRDGGWKIAAATAAATSPEFS
jgi:hypothetical protein